MQKKKKKTKMHVCEKVHNEILNYKNVSWYYHNHTKNKLYTYTVVNIYMHTSICVTSWFVDK